DRLALAIDDARDLRRPIVLQRADRRQVAAVIREHADRAYKTERRGREPDQRAPKQEGPRTRLPERTPAHARLVAHGEQCGEESLEARRVTHRVCRLWYSATISSARGTLSRT